VDRKSVMSRQEIGTGRVRRRRCRDALAVDGLLGAAGQERVVGWGIAVPVHERGDPACNRTNQLFDIGLGRGRLGFERHG